MGTGRGRLAPVRIRSDALAAHVHKPQAGATTGLTAFSFDMCQAQAAPPRRGGVWRERDLRRALVVARLAGLRDYRIELAPDGTISIVVGT